MLTQRIAKTLLLIVFGSSAGLAFSSCLPLPVPFPLLRGERAISTNTTSLVVKWRHRIDGILWAPLVHQAGIVYGPQGDTPKAVDADTGELKWSFTNHDRAVSFSPEITASQDVVAFQTAGPSGERQKINVVDGKTGTLKWEQRLSTVYAFAVGHGKLYVGSLAQVSAYDLQDGTLRWETSGGLPARSVINVYYDEGQVYATTYNRVHRLDAVDGHAQDSYEYTNSEFEILSQRSLFSVVSPGIIDRSAEIGEIRWRKKINPDIQYVPPTLVGNTLFVRTSSDTLVSLDADTGEVNWESKELGSPFSNIVLFHGTGYVVSKDGSLRCFDLSSGKAKGALTTTPQELASQAGVPGIPSLAAIGDTLVVAFGDSYVFGFAAKALPGSAYGSASKMNSSCPYRLRSASSKVLVNFERLGSEWPRAVCTGLPGEKP